MDPEYLNEIIQRALVQLTEFFPNVQIHVSYPCASGDGGTWALHRGMGDYYARVALARDFVKNDDAERLGRHLND